jgi:hypothetical protein
VGLLPENETAGFVFSVVKDQWITAGASNMPVDINVTAIMEVINLYEIPNPQDVFRQVLAAGRVWINGVVKKAKK